VFVAICTIWDTIRRDRYDLSPPPRKVQAKPYEFRNRFSGNTPSNSVRVGPGFRLSFTTVDPLSLQSWVLCLIQLRRNSRCSYLQNLAVLREIASEHIDVVERGFGGDEVRDQARLVSVMASLRSRTVQFYGAHAIWTPRWHIN
jgi:hypothetical protein